MYEYNNNESNNFENKETVELRENTQDYKWGNTQPVQEPKKQEKKSTGILRKVVVAACCGLCFGLFGGLGLYAVRQVTELTDAMQEEVLKTNTNDKVESGNVQTALSDADDIKVTNTSQVSVVTSDYSEVVEEVMPAMVSILNTYLEKETWWGQSYSYESQSSGSGIIIAETDSELLIATNHHVVTGAETIEVTFIDGSVATALVKGTDADMDLAVIAIDLESLSGETMQNIAVAKMGDSDALKLGEPVIAIGNALGYGQSVTGGYVSALNREIELEDGSTGTFIQTDAAINPGNSGGALLNINGEVIGINSNKIGGTAIEGMGYAIPITAAEPIIEDLMSKETKHKIEDGNVGYIGINLMTVTEEMAYMYNFPQGIFVRSVEEGSPAEAAGIINGDIIVNFDGEKITSYEDLEEVLQYYGPGSTASITVKRATNGQYQEVDLTITLGEQPQQNMQ